MEQSPTPTEWWSILLMAAMGALVGIVLATVWSMLHNHSDLPPEEMLWHFIPDLLGTALAGAVLLGGIAALRDWLKRHR